LPPGSGGVVHTSDARVLYEKEESLIAGHPISCLPSPACLDKVYLNIYPRLVLNKQHEKRPGKDIKERPKRKPLRTNTPGKTTSNQKEEGYA